MSNYTNAMLRLAICAVLFATWIALVVFQVPGDGQIIDVIKYSLAMLGGYHAGDRINAQLPVPSPVTIPASSVTNIPQAKDSP